MNQNERKHLSLREIAMFGDCFVFVVGISKKPMKCKVSVIDFDQNKLHVTKDQKSYVVNPHQVKVILTHQDDLHDHIKHTAESIMEVESPEKSLLYLLKKKVDIVGYIDQGTAIRNRATKNVNQQEADI
jgi:hypothetical protein